jgi:hypothetical protein
MKFRNGFVTNSSSSSFICDVCGETASGYDMSMEDEQMHECKNGHTFCDDHKLKVLNKVIKKGIDSDEEDDEYNEEDERYEIDPIYCPICQFKALHKKDALAFLLKKNELTELDVLKELKGTFSSYDNFLEYIKESK